MDFLTLNAGIRPNSLAIQDLNFDRQWTYAELNVFVAKVTSWLKKQGISEGERVACLSKNRAEIIALHLACARLGAIFVPLNWRLVLEELNNILTDCEPSILIADEMGAQHGLEYFDINELFSASISMSTDTEVIIDEQLPSLILYTSGTTGTPKGVMLSEKNLAETSVNSSLLYQIDTHSAFLCESPMFHIIGIISSVRPVLGFGGRVVISDGFIPARTLARLSDPDLAITHYFCVPQMANTLRNEESFKPTLLKGLKALFTGGAPHPEVQIRSWLKDGIPIVDGFGMSEAGTLLGMPVDINSIDKKAGCVGLPTHRIKVRLANDEEEVDVDLAGELQLKGDNICIGYWRRETEYSEAFTSDGWFKTGDIAIKDSDGFFRIVDRKKDMFISGGENIFPTEIEAVVLRHDSILECALIGLPDERWGEVGCLFLVTKKNKQLDDNQEMINFLDEHIARYKLPKIVVTMEALPRNGAGKVMKHILKTEYLAK